MGNPLLKGKHLKEKFYSSGKASIKVYHFTSIPYFKQMEEKNS